MTVVLAVLFGVVIGVSLGALGGGGSILTVPVLVYVIGETARGATTASLVIVGITALVGALGHARSGNVRWNAGIVFGVIGVGASYLGTDLNRHVNPNALLLAFAALMLIAAVAMLRRARPLTPTDTPAPPDAGHERGSRAAGGTVAALAATPRLTARQVRVTPRTAAKVVAASLVVGFLTGFLGVGGGFIIVPALVIAMDFSMPVAVGTSLLVIALNSAAALAARSGNETFHWAVIVPFTFAAIAGSLAGKTVADKVSGTTLSRAFAGLLIAVAIYVAVRSGIGLS